MQPPQPLQQETMVRVYRNPGQYQNEARKLAQQAWSVVNVTERKPRAGCLRIITLGLFSLIFPPKPELVVTYSRLRQR